MRTLGQAVGGLAIVAALALACSARGATPPATPAPTPKPTVCAPLVDRHLYDYPAWSKDGTQIYYDESPTGINADIRVMNPDGTGDRLFIPNASRARPSPDGTKLMLTLYRGTYPGTLRGDLAVVELPHDATTPLVTAVPGGQGSLKILQQIPDAVDGAWSPDSQWIAYSYQDGGGNHKPIFMMNVASGETRAVSPVLDDPVAWDSQPLWSPDGSAIAYQSERRDQSYVTIIRADSLPGSAQPGTPAFMDTNTCTYLGSEIEILEGWLPDSSGVIVTRICDEDQGLFIVRPDGTGRKLPGTEIADGSVQWSPNGGRFTFQSHTGYTILVDILDYRTGGIWAVQLNAHDARWSPDGRHIVMVGTDASGLSALKVMDADGYHVQQLTPDQDAKETCWP